MGLDLIGFFKLYVAKKKIRVVYRLLRDYLEVIDVIGIGKREKEEVYQLIIRRLRSLQKK
jgi:hypothetical protein